MSNIVGPLWFAYSTPEEHTRIHNLEGRERLQAQRAAYLHEEMMIFHEGDVVDVVKHSKDKIKVKCFLKDKEYWIAKEAVRE